PSDTTETGMGIRASSDKSVGGYDWLQLPRIPIIMLLNRAKNGSTDGFIFVGLSGYNMVTLKNLFCYQIYSSQFSPVSRSIDYLSKYNTSTPITCHRIRDNYTTGSTGMRE